MAASIHYVDAPLGHEIRGVDLTRELPDADFKVIEKAYDDYGVITIRNQKLTPDQQIAYSRRFGPLTQYVTARYNMKTHPEIFIVSNAVDETGRNVGLEDAGRYWHTDMWVTANPPRGSILYAIEVPEKDGQVFGDTYFSSTAAAYDALPEDLRKTIEGRKAVFSSEAYFNARMARTPKDPVTGDYSPGVKERAVERTKNTQQEHAMVKVHPRSGRKCIYFSEEAMTHIVGMEEKESAEVLEAVHQHVLRPEFIYRHRWQVGDLVMWDNISCIHKATGDFTLPLRRTMHRTTLGHVPATA